jgi:hypothetical protein
MVTKIRIALVVISTLATAAAAPAQDRARLQPGFKAGQQVRYLLTAAVETQVTPVEQNGLSSSARRELSATLTLATLGVEDSGEVRQDATIESISFTSTQNGVEQQVNVGELKGKKIELTLGPSGQVLKLSIPTPAERLGVVELLINMTRWFPAADVTVGQTWEAAGQGPIYSESLSEIAKGSATVYKLAALSESTASIEGATTLNQRGAAVLTAKEGRTDVNVIAAGQGSSRFDFDIKAGRIIGGAVESRLEGRLAYIAPAREGEKLQPRMGTIVETAKYSIKTVN